MRQVDDREETMRWRAVVVAGGVMAAGSALGADRLTGANGPVPQHPVGPFGPEEGVGELWSGEPTPELVATQSPARPPPTFGPYEGLGEVGPGANAGAQSASQGETAAASQGSGSSSVETAPAPETTGTASPQGTIDPQYGPSQGLGSPGIDPTQSAGS